MSKAFEIAVSKLLTTFSINFKPFPLAPDQTKLVLTSLLQRKDLTDIEKSAVFIGLNSFFALQQQLQQGGQQ